jgi:SOS response regulatory protein OraA/RecX
MENLNKQIEETLNIIEQTTTFFYQQRNQEGYQLMNNMLNTMMQTINTLYTLKAKDNQINIDEETINMILGKAMKAIEQGDLILLSDILVFEFSNILRDCYTGSSL